MKQKRTLFAILLMALAIPQSVMAYDFSAVAPTGQTMYYEIVNGGNSEVEVVGCSSNNSTVDSVVIPATVTYNSTTYTVKRIGVEFISRCGGVTSITIPNSVTIIRDRAFYELFTLTSITIPNSIVFIGEGAFCRCESLTTVNFNATNCTTMGSSDLPVFYGCDSLTTLNIGNNVTRIPANAFRGCTGLTSVTIPSSVISIGNSAFYGCSRLSTLNFNADSCTYMGYLSNNLIYDAFSKSLTTINIGSNVKVIPDYAFPFQGSLRNVNFPASSSLEYIGAYAFFRDSSLTNFTLPDAVSSIGRYVFMGCSHINSPVYNSRLFAYMPQSITGGYTIPDGIATVGFDSFYGCTGLTSVTIPNSVISINTNAFKGCTGLSSAIIGNGVTTIGEEAFSGCTHLPCITIPNSVTSVLDSAFKNCTGLIEITFERSQPPMFAENVFKGVSPSCTVYIPCGSLALYMMRLPNFSTFVEQDISFTAESADESMGTVQILNVPTCANPNAVLNAIPNNGYRFDHWSTGSTDNPYNLNVSGTLSVIAYFVSEGGNESIDDISNNGIEVYSRNGFIIVEGAEGMPVMLYDATGRLLATRRGEDAHRGTPVQFNVPASGTYLIKVGNHPARKVVVVR